MSLSTTEHAHTTARREHSTGPRHRSRNARRALAAAVATPSPLAEGVRLHPIELGPWDD